MGRKLGSGVLATIALAIASASSVAFAQGAEPRAPATRRDVPPPSPTSGGTLPAAPPTGVYPSAPETDGEAAPSAPTSSAPVAVAPPPAVGFPPLPPSAPPPPPSAPAAGAVPPPPIYQPVYVERPRPSRTWYGGQTLLVDGASIALVVAGAASSNDSGAVIGIGALAYLLGPAVVHIAHGNGGTAAGSIGMRLLPPLLVIAGVASCFQSSRCDSGQGALIVIGALGFPAVIAVDAAALSYEDEDAPAAPRTGSLRVAPFVDPKTHRGGFAISGAF